MSQTLVTIATYWDSTEARLARMYLEAAGIRSILQNEHSVTMNWLEIANASRGVQLQVDSADVDAAIEVLEQKSPGTDEIGDEWNTPPEITLDEGEAPTAESAPYPPLSPEVDDEHIDDREHAPLNLREQRIKRADVTSILGLVFWPILFYATYLLGLIAISKEPIRSTLHKLIWRAVAINGFMMGLLYLTAFMLNWY
jgi:hypothetical protein